MKNLFLIVSETSNGSGEDFFIQEAFDHASDAIDFANWYYFEHLTRAERKRTRVSVVTDYVAWDWGCEYRTIWDTERGLQ